MLLVHLHTQGSKITRYWSAIESFSGIWVSGSAVDLFFMTLKVYAAGSSPSFSRLLVGLCRSSALLPEADKFWGRALHIGHIFGKFFQFLGHHLHSSLTWILSNTTSGTKYYILVLDAKNDLFQLNFHYFIGERQHTCNATVEHPAIQNVIRSTRVLGLYIYQPSHWLDYDGVINFGRLFLTQPFFIFLFTCRKMKYFLGGFRFIGDVTIYYFKKYFL